MAKKIELLPVQVLPEIPEQGLDVYQYLTERYGTKEANRICWENRSIFSESPRPSVRQPTFKVAG
jgi:hypothetical protein